MRASAQSAARLSASTDARSRRAFAVKIPGARRFKFEQSRISGVTGPRKILSRARRNVQIFERQINAAHFVVAAHVANDIGQLKRDAQFFGQVRRVRIVKSEHVQAREAHRPGHAIAIFAQAVERGIRRRRSNPFPRRRIKS